MCIYFSVGKVRELLMSRIKIESYIRYPMDYKAILTKYW